jgi:NAD(P)-dependent dehydrogenase (short-subunit alcohol dehydrogenase family)
VDETFRKFGKLDVLINNAAFRMERHDLREITTEEFERTFRTDVFAMFWLSKAVLARMRI